MVTLAMVTFNKYLLSNKLEATDGRPVTDGVGLSSQWQYRLAITSPAISNPEQSVIRIIFATGR